MGENQNEMWPLVWETARTIMQVWWFNKVQIDIKTTYASAHAVELIPSLHDGVVAAGKGVGRKIFKEMGGEQRKKDRKIAKKTKIVLLSLFRGGTEKRQKNSKKWPKNITHKPLSTIHVSCMKIQGGTAAADAHDSGYFALEETVNLCGPLVTFPRMT